MVMNREDTFVFLFLNTIFDQKKKRWQHGYAFSFSYDHF